MTKIMIDGNEYLLNPKKQPVSAYVRTFTKKHTGKWEKKGFIRLALQVKIDGDPFPVGTDLVRWSAKQEHAAAAVKTADLKELSNGKEITVFGLWEGEAKEYGTGTIIMEES